jgi:hypothetical protein
MVALKLTKIWDGILGRKKMSYGVFGVYTGIWVEGKVKKKNHCVFWNCLDNKEWEMLCMHHV